MPAHRQQRQGLRLQIGGASGGDHQGVAAGANAAAQAEQMQADDNQADDDRLGNVPARSCTTRVVMENPAHVRMLEAATPSKSSAAAMVPLGTTHRRMRCSGSARAASPRAAPPHPAQPHAAPRHPAPPARPVSACAAPPRAALAFPAQSAVAWSDGSRSGRWRSALWRSWSWLVATGGALRSRRRWHSHQSSAQPLAPPLALRTSDASCRDLQSG